MEKRGLGRGLAALIPENRQGTADRDVAAPDKTAEMVRQIPVEQVEANPYQPRALFDPEKMADLVASVKEHGILQPVLVRRMGPARYQLVAGERRFRAAEKAGLSSIPAVIKECTDREQLEIAVVENLQREDIGVMEAARAYRRLIDDFEMTQDTVAQRVGKSRSAVANVLRLLRLPDEVQESLEQGEITEGHARALMMAEFSQAILHTWHETRKKSLSVRDTEKLAKRSRNAVSGGGPEAALGIMQTVDLATKTPAGSSAVSDPNEADVADRLQQTLGTKVTIRHGAGGGGKIEIEFYSPEELERLTSALLLRENR
jgi:ParB family chromosome partitioning protein